MMTGKKLDERQNKLIGESMAIAAVLAFIYELVIILYTFNKTGSVKSVYTEIILVTAMSLFMFVYYIVTGEYDSSIEKGNKRRSPFKLDEREKNRIITSAGMVNFVAILFSLGVILFRLVETRNFQSSYSFIGLLLLISATMGVYNLINKEYDVPTTYYGKIIPLGNSKKDKKARVIYYGKKALRITIIFFILDVINPNRVIFSIASVNSKVILPYFLNSFFRFIIFIILNYLWGEYNIRKQRKYNESLDDEVDT